MYVSSFYIERLNQIDIVKFNDFVVKIAKFYLQWHQGAKMGWQNIFCYRLKLNAKIVPKAGDVEDSLHV